MPSKIELVVRSAPALLRTIGQQRKERPRLENSRDSQLRRLVRHAYANVQFYRMKFDAHGVDIRRFRGYGDLHLLPILTKDELRSASQDELLANGTKLRTLRVSKTNGTTGESITVRRAHAESLILKLTYFQAFRSFGVSLRDTSIGIKIPAPGTGRRFGPVRRLASAIGFYPRWEIDPRDMDEVIRVLHRARPAVIGGWPSVMSVVAERWEADARASDERLWPKFVHTGGELLDPGARRRIEEVFRAPVRDTYSSEEFGLIAWQCRHTGVYHTSDETIAVESLREDGSSASVGEAGLCTGTALQSFAAPLIRYRLGDAIALGGARCACGAPFSTIEIMAGRTKITFRGADGRLIAVYRIQEVVTAAAPWVRQTQVVRELLDTLTVRVAATRTPTAAEIEAVRLSLKDYLGPSMRCEVEVASDLDAGSTEKFRTLIDKVA